ncbi:MAG: hypothetical protein GY705_27905 [Bacteroidetes bacterium]|nr:hypothetical protein [Bacteroidota bacterium]
MKIASAISLEIAQLKLPAITGYQIGRIIYRLYSEKKCKGKPITNIKKNAPNRNDYSRYVKELISIGLINNDLISHNEIFGVISQNQHPAEELACCIDPFIYVSHLSAMEYHGLTDRFPKVLFLTSPRANEWSRLARKQMEKDLENKIDDYLQTGLPKLKRLHIDKITKKSINTYTSIKYTPGAYLSLKGQCLKVSSIGRTFYDMLKNPVLCGGIYHVLDVYEEYAKKYLRLIVDEFERHGNAIDLVRAGYVLSERLGLSEPRIERWKEKVQRGGSRKLVADEPYKPIFSEEWCLSLNIEGSGD